MVFQVVKIGLLTDPFKLTDNIVRKLRGLKIFLTIPQSIKNVEKAIKIAKYIEADGIVLPLSTIVKTDIINKLTEYGSFNIVLKIDIKKITQELKYFISTLTQIHEITPLIDIKYVPCVASILEIPRISVVIVDYKSVTNTTISNFRKVLSTVLYFRDYVLTLMKSRNISVGSVVTKMSYKSFEIIREIVTLSTMFIVTKIEDALLLQSVLEKMTTSQFYNFVSRLYVPDEAKVEVTIE